MRVLWVAALIILVDQATKLTVLQTMYRGQSIPLVGDWLRFTFTENPGMAFGIQVGPPGLITVFALLVTGLIVYYIYQIRGAYYPYRLSLAFILGGAIGNIIDRVFYGVMLDYNGYFRGHVVDFIHVDMWRGHLPEFLPLIGGSYTALFPIWNVADMAIVAGVVGILIFQNRFHDELMESADEAEVEPTEGSIASTLNGEQQTSSDVTRPVRPADGVGDRLDPPAEDAPKPSNRPHRRAPLRSEPGEGPAVEEPTREACISSAAHYASPSSHYSASHVVSGVHPQLQHHCPHRPWQEHAG